MSGTIPLSRGKIAIVDDADYDWLVAMGKWTLHSMGYAYRWDRSVKPNKCILMHRVVNKTPDGLETDHINGNKLDNRSSNLRAATRTLNSFNKPSKGAYLPARCKTYAMEMIINGKKVWIGL